MHYLAVTVVAHENEDIPGASYDGCYRDTFTREAGTPPLSNDAMTPAMCLLYCLTFDNVYQFFGLWVSAILN